MYQFRQFSNPRKPREQYSVLTNNGKLKTQLFEGKYYISIITKKENTGHSLILVEGIKNGQLVVGQYDIKATTVDKTPLICDVRMCTSNQYVYKREDYADMAGKGYGYIDEEKFCLMRESIAQDRQDVYLYQTPYEMLLDLETQTEKEKDWEKLRLIQIAITEREKRKKRVLGKKDPRLGYTEVGRYSIFNKSGGHNCRSWCLEKLAVVGIDASEKRDALVSTPRIGLHSLLGKLGGSQSLSGSRN